ncbi:MAG: hypothetical protein SRB2_03813 [Desulfobacteraceae bacterium Eth-SRB2]|nr:MAG: hypothetical protein SRB2_03813 [Desulfobacteraceae bacterium Eth-SRB2]
MLRDRFKSTMISVTCCYKEIMQNYYNYDTPLNYVVSITLLETPQHKGANLG